MSRFNTGNKLPSLDERDFYDNSMALDEAMNSTKETFVDRFGVEKPTIDAALKSAGFMPAGFDFVTGGTLQPGDRNKAVFNPAPNGDNNWYRWNGVFPKVITANSQPEPKNENSWVPVNVKTTTLEREALRRTYEIAGLNLVKGSFEAGGTLTNSSDVLLHEESGNAYSGSGPFPQDVRPNTDPLSGGFKDESNKPITVIGNMLIFYKTPSYTALVSDPSKFSDDFATRLYICPREKVVTGTGGAIKIFADPYHKGGLSDYRDFGLYFSADQKGILGKHGNGTFYLNSKVSGLPTGEYAYGNPDIACTFQDGQAEAWRSIYLPADANGPTRAVTVFGKTESTTAGTRNDISIELANKMGIDRFGGIAFWGEGGFSTVFEHRPGSDGLDLFRFNYYNAVKLSFKWAGVDQGIIADTRIIGRQATISSGGGNLSAAGFNSVLFTNTSIRSIADFIDGLPGQEITLVFTTTATTLVHGTQIKLKGGVNFTSTVNSTIKLINAGGVWYEVSRSV